MPTINETEEDLCRIICKAEDVNPDAESIGLGNLMPVNQKYKLWEARRRVAKAIIEAGYKKLPILLADELMKLGRRIHIKM